MKTLITLAMLSAAGTAFAGFTQDEAAGWLVKTEDGSYVNSSSTTFTQNDDGSLTLALSDGAWVTTASTGRTEYTLAVTLNFDLLSVDAATALFSMNTDTYVTGISAGTDDKFYGIWGSSLNYSPTLDFSAFTGECTVVFTMMDAGTRFYQDAGTFWTNASLKGSVGSTANTLTISSAAADALVNVVGWAEACTGTASNTANAAAAFSTAQNLVIPEPSAFGLLAGVGALALVAARRRRTK